MASKETKHPKDAGDFHLNQLAAVGQIAAGIAHEVKNPLTAVKGFLQLLKEEHNEGYLNIAQTELNNALSTIEGLLQVSKPDLDDEPYQLIKPAAELEAYLRFFKINYTG
ncbi:histidine kinase dimerization/phospho-acceptor domain-containing protein [Brevibacillus sp. NRS-1366]|uniref:histidine kinase dimerization/phospho-acceptor domain-containing protein n=1 Tax=Brevibacillus sp. NRS-1366 TaxID=3233899 RepID=UPI003D240959